MNIREKEQYKQSHDQMVRDFVYPSDKKNNQAMGLISDILYRANILKNKEQKDKIQTLAQNAYQNLKEIGQLLLDVEDIEQREIDEKWSKD